MGRNTTLLSMEREVTYDVRLKLQAADQRGPYELEGWAEEEAMRLFNEAHPEHAPCKSATCRQAYYDGVGTVPGTSMFDCIVTLYVGKEN